MTTTLSRGLAAGAVGTTVLNAVTWLDMAITGRAASDAPERTTAAVLDALGAAPPKDDHARQAYGALGGIAAGLGVGVLASAARSLGLRVSAPVGAVLTGAAAMAASDLPMAATGVSDPREWTRTDWVRDVVPHLAYGVGVRWTLDRLSAHDDAAETRRTERPVTTGLLARSAALGLAAGGRTSLGLSGPLAGGGVARQVAALGLAVPELVVDKLPATTSRLVPGALVGRAAAGGIGSGVLARRQGASPVLPVLVGAAAAYAGSIAGAAWREVAAQRGWTWQAAVAEDAVDLGLAWLAVRGTAS